MNVHQSYIVVGIVESGTRTFLSLSKFSKSFIMVVFLSILYLVSIFIGLCTPLFLVHSYMLIYLNILKLVGFLSLSNIIDNLIYFYLIQGTSIGGKKSFSYKRVKALIKIYSWYKFLKSFKMVYL